MASPLPDVPRDPVVRFRVRTLLIVTTVFAVLSAIAGPVYRIAPDEGRSNLLLFWTAIITCCAISYFVRLREAFLRSKSDSVRFVVYSHTGKSGGGRRIVGGASCLAFLAVLITLTYDFGFDTTTSQRSEIFTPLYWGFILGSGVAGYIVTFVRQPLYLCDGGIPLAKGHFAPWKYIRGAEWVASPPNVMKLSRYDGDVYIDVPSAIREDVAEFIREKTTIFKK